MSFSAPHKDYPYPIGPPAPDPADVAIPPGTPNPSVIIHGDDYGG
jgi:hypothetical protein